jgi:hypothetical protein
MIPAKGITSTFAVQSQTKVIPVGRILCQKIANSGEGYPGTMKIKQVSACGIIAVAFILLTCTTVLGQDQGCLTENTKTIELFDLISMYLIPSSVQYNVQAWKTGAEHNSPIDWQTSGISWNKKRKAYIREGRAVVTVSGIPVCILKKYWEPSAWYITLVGAHAGIYAVEISSREGSNKFDLETEMTQRQITYRLYKCDPEGLASVGERLYYIQVPQKKPAWMYYEWSCGSGGCGGDLKLFLSKKDADRIPNLTTSCGENK